MESSTATIKERLQAIMQRENLSPARFADRLEVQRSGISHILSGRNKPSLELLVKILKHFPKVSGDWLISGEGNMLKGAQVVTPLKTEQLQLPSLDQKTESKPATEESAPLVNQEEEPPVYKRPPVYKKKSVEPATSDKPVSKQIEKILVFYSDRSFREYIPDKD
jgi:transcriptional regulator with XRE-family HTH domain